VVPLRRLRSSRMAYSVALTCIGWSSTETTRASRLTANLPVRIVASGWL
jgi:hypothetical protein